MRILGLTLFIFSFLNIGNNSHSAVKVDQVMCPTKVDRLGIEVLNRINPLSIKNDFEYGGLIYIRPDGILDATPPYTDKESHKLMIPSLYMLQIKGHQVARYHTHGAKSEGFDDESFSKIDTSNVTIDQYLGTPDWNIFKFDCHVRRVYKYNTTTDIWTIVTQTSQDPDDEYFPPIPELELYYKLPWLFNPSLSF